VSERDANKSLADAARARAGNVFDFQAERAKRRPSKWRRDPQMRKILDEPDLAGTWGPWYPSEFDT